MEYFAFVFTAMLSLDCSNRNKHLTNRSFMCDLTVYCQFNQKVTSLFSSGKSNKCHSCFITFVIDHKEITSCENSSHQNFNSIGHVFKTQAMMD